MIRLSSLQLLHCLWTHLHSNLAAHLAFAVHAGSPRKLLFVRIFVCPKPTHKFGPEMGKPLGFRGPVEPWSEEHAEEEAL